MTSTFIPKNGWTWIVQHTFTEVSERNVFHGLIFTSPRPRPPGVAIRRRRPVQMGIFGSTTWMAKILENTPAGWWLNQPIWKICASQMGSSSPIFGVLKKHIWNDTKKWPYSKGENIFPRLIILGIQPLVFVGVNPPPKAAKLSASEVLSWITGKGLSTTCYTRPPRRQWCSQLFVKASLMGSCCVWEPAVAWFTWFLCIMVLKKIGMI